MVRRLKSSINIGRAHALEPLGLELDYIIKVNKLLRKLRNIFMRELMRNTEAPERRYPKIIRFTLSTFSMALRNII